MDKRQLGRSELRVAPLCSAATCSAGRRTSRRRSALLDRFVEAGLDFIDTADVYSSWVPGNKGGESETIIGKWLKRRGGRDKVVIATKVGSEMAPDSKGLSQALDPPGGRGLAAPPADRPHRPLPVALRRPGDADRGDAGRFRRADRGGQGAGHRRVELHRRRGCGRRSRSARATRLPRYESLQPQYNLYDRAGLRGRARAAVPRGRGSASSPTSRSPAASSPASTAPRRTSARARAARASASISTSAACASWRRWTRWRRSSRHAGPGGARLADRPARHHRPDRQRHQAGAAGGPDRCCMADSWIPRRWPGSTRPAASTAAAHPALIALPKYATSRPSMSAARR